MPSGSLVFVPSLLCGLTVSTEPVVLQTEGHHQSEVVTHGVTAANGGGAPLLVSAGCCDNDPRAYQGGSWSVAASSPNRFSWSAVASATRLFCDQALLVWPSPEVLKVILM